MRPASRTRGAIERYLGKQSDVGLEIGQYPQPAPGLKLAIVIPSLAEKETLPQVLASLELGSRRLAEAEVIVLVNNPAQPQASMFKNNQDTLAWLATRIPGRLRVVPVDRSSPGLALSPAHAGVGLARKLGMDLALQRLWASGGDRPAAIACLDADSPVTPGYVDCLLEQFAQADAPLGGICAYAHPWPDNPRHRQAIVAYELWLRYFEFGFYLAGSLFAYPTIGSCTVVSSRGYALADGMPTCQAAEDFHFMRKIIKVSGYRPLAKISRVTVQPSARVSNRVPFGTGRAMARALQENSDAYQRVEPPEAFLELRDFFTRLSEGHASMARWSQTLCPPVREFLDAEGAWGVLEKIRANNPQCERFCLAVQHWFDSLRMVRYVNQRTRVLSRVPLLEAWQRLAAHASPATVRFVACAGEEACLTQLRQAWETHSTAPR